MKINALFVLAFAIVFFFVPNRAYAHFPAMDGDMTVTLHVDPNDDPIPGQQAQLYFLFDDTAKRFTLSNCTCTVSIIGEGKQMYRQQLIDTKNNKPSVWGASMPYIFPQRNVYNIVLTGNPKKANEFQPFTLSWYFRVDTINPGLVPVQQQEPSDIEILLGALGVVILGLIIFGVFIKKQLSG